MTFKAVVQRIHLWTGLLLGIQVLLWMASGVIMSWFHLDLVRGETNSLRLTPPELEATAYASPGGVIAQTDGATSVVLRTFENKPVYEVRGAFGAALFDANTGEQLSPISEETARAVAKRDFTGDGDVVRVALLENPPHEYRREKPVWRVDFDDPRNTRIYVSPSTAQIVSRRNDIWRLYDFFWMLHIMDYDERENFNNPLVKAASATGLVFAMSGMIIVVYRLRRGRYSNDVKLAVGAKPKKTVNPSQKNS